MAKKLLLEYDDENPYYYLGISSSIRDYQMVFDLNKHLNLKFSHAEAFRFSQKGQELEYSFYIYIDHDNMVNYYLLSNHDANKRLVPTYKQIDFFIIVEGEITEEEVNDLARKVKSLPRTLFASQLDAEQFEKIKGLRYAFDMHLEKVLKVL